MNMPVLGVTIGLLAVLSAICLLPVRVDSAEDEGDGRTVVVIPGHAKTPPHRPRTWAFLTMAAALGLVFVVWPQPSALFTVAGLCVIAAATSRTAPV